MYPLLEQTDFNQVACDNNKGTLFIPYYYYYYYYCYYYHYFHFHYYYYYFQNNRVFVIITAGMTRLSGMLTIGTKIEMLMVLTKLS